MKLMITSIIFFAFILISCSESDYLTKISDNGAHYTSDTIIDTKNKTTFDEVKAKYDTLIPIFEGLFITYHKTDTASFSDYSNNGIVRNDLLELSNSEKKWGVIDSNDHVIIPFMCDGIKEISKNKGIVSVYSNFWPLNTGIPRYQYFGTYYYFSNTGILNESKNDFSLRIEGFSDYHKSKFVIELGPEFYLPNESNSMYGRIH